MSIQHDFNIPEFGIGDRLRLAMRDRGISGEQAADYFTVAPQTISNWLNGHTSPNRRVLRKWSLWLGVPLTWLQTGEKPSPNDGDGLSLLPRVDSNHQPADCWRDSGRMPHAARFRTWESEQEAA